MNNTIVKTYLTLVFITLGALWIAQRTGISFPIYSVLTNRSSEFIVNDEGKAEAKPDKATMHVGVMIQSASSEADAKKRLDEKNNAIVSALIKYGIAKNDIMTKDYSIYPSYEGLSNTKKTYSATVSIQITVRNVDQIGKLTNIVTEAGANQINGIDYAMTDKETLKAKAREQGIAKAKKQAQQLAKETGLKLGNITNITVYYPTDGPVVYDSMQRAEKASPEAYPTPNIQTGLNSITAQVTLFYEVR